MRISDWSSDVCSSDLFLPGGDMAQAGLAHGGEIQQRQPARKKLAIDDTLRKPRNEAEADPLRQFAKRVADAAHVARLQMRQQVPQDPPVPAAAVGACADLARVPTQLGIKAWPLHPLGR